MAFSFSYVPNSFLVLCVIVVAVAVKFYLKLTTGMYRGTERLDGKTVIVTGANTGIGKEAAMDFAKRGARVILACRDMKRANAARDDIIGASGNQDVVVRTLNLACMTSVREFAREIVATEPRIDVLVNNAGAGGLGEKITEDGLQLGMAVNYFGPFLLTNLLVDLLKRSAPSRIIFVSSITHKWVKLNLEDLNFEKSCNEYNLYGNSKLGNILNANELARRLEGTGVTVNSLNPGSVATDIFDRLPTWMHGFMKLSKLFFKTPVEGAQTTIYLAVSQDVADVTGRYFEDCKESKMSKDAADMELARKLWEKTELLLKPKQQ